MVLLGPPGVGKGTQAELLCKALGTCHLSTGDVFRAAQCQTEHSPALKAALEAMRRGELVSDGLVVSMVSERSGCLSCFGGFLLDGFPRTVAQAEALDELLEQQGVSLDAVLSYELPLAEIVDRLSGRRTCSKCKAVFHVTARPPQRKGSATFAEAALIQREDDRPESIRVRMQAYEESTRPAGRLLSEDRAVQDRQCPGHSRSHPGAVAGGPGETGFPSMPDRDEFASDDLSLRFSVGCLHAADRLDQ